MRVATWNLQRASAPTAVLQEAVLADIAADITVLTEVPASRSVSSLDVVLSPVKRQGRVGAEAWVAIVAENAQAIEPAPPFERLAVAARVPTAGTDVIVYGSVLPWLAAPHHAPELARPGETSAEMFTRVLDDQVADLLSLHQRFRNVPVLWVGDFNQSLEGPCQGGSRARRVLLADALRRLGLIAWNSSASHVRPRACAIDLICGPRLTRVHRVEYVAPAADGRVLSDHAAYFADVVLGSA